MRFRFKLQRALDFAHMRERRKQNQLVSSKQREQILMRYLSDTQERLRTSLKRLTSAPSSPLAMVLSRSIENDNEDIRRLERTVSEERDAQVRLQSELLRLVMRRKALESLKEKQYGDHRAEQRLHEQKILDEVSSLNWQRGQKAEGADE